VALEAVVVEASLHTSEIPLRLELTMQVTVALVPRIRAVAAAAAVRAASSLLLVQRVGSPLVELVEQVQLALLPSPMSPNEYRVCQCE
jgi:hypothetical protein